MTLNSVIFFFFNDTATTEIYTLSLHDALPILLNASGLAARTMPRIAASAAKNAVVVLRPMDSITSPRRMSSAAGLRSEEHTSELQSQSNLVCRLLLEKKKKNTDMCISPARNQH